MTITYRDTKGQALTAAEFDANTRDLDERPNGQVYPKTKNTGIKVDTAAPDFGWEDLIGDMQDHMSGAAGIAASPAVYVGEIGQAQYDVGDSQTFMFHIPHDWVQGHDAFIHIHWSHNSPSVTAGDVTFQFEVTSAKGHNQMAFPTPKIGTVTETASTARYQHMIAETPFCENLGGIGDLLLHSEDMEVDSLVICNVKLIGNTMTGLAKPFVHTVDLHYQSTGIGTKNRNPTPTFWG